jgi:hypothetical protein
MEEAPFAGAARSLAFVTRFLAVSRGITILLQQGSANRIPAANGLTAPVAMVGHGLPRLPSGSSPQYINPIRTNSRDPG